MELQKLTAASPLLGPRRADVSKLPAAALSAGASAAAEPPAAVPPARFECGVAAVLALTALLVALVAWDVSAHLHDGDALVAYYAAAAAFVTLTVPLALLDIHRHLAHFVSPLQGYYVRILFLLPIYSLESWLALRFEAQALYLATIRDLYEAFVVHAFFQLLLRFLGDRERLKSRLASRGAFVNVTLFPYGLAPLEPFACEPPDRGGWFPCLFWPSGGVFLFRTEVGVYQYVVVKVVFTVAFFVSSVTGSLGENTPYAYTSFWPWWSWGILASQVWAITCLVLFYESTWRWLAPLQPLRKFVCVKGMVFVTWAQGELIYFLKDLGLVSLPGVPGLTPDEAAEALQDVIICVEMLLLAYMHHLYFSADDFDTAAPGGGAALNEPRRGLSFMEREGASRTEEGGDGAGDGDADGAGGDSADIGGGDAAGRGKDAPEGARAGPPPEESVRAALPLTRGTMSARDVALAILPVDIVTTDLRVVFEEGIAAPLRSVARRSSPDKADAARPRTAT